MAEIEKVVPILPVPLVAAALASHPADRAGLLAEVTRLAQVLEAKGAVLKLPPQGLEAAMDEGLAPLIARGIVKASLQTAPNGQVLLDFYASALWQRMGQAADDIAATRQT
jgi:glycerol-3-phosphate O-acyltransferase